LFSRFVFLNGLFWSKIGQKWRNIPHISKTKFFFRNRIGILRKVGNCPANSERLKKMIFVVFSPWPIWLATDFWRENFRKKTNFM